MSIGMVGFGSDQSTDVILVTGQSNAVGYGGLSLGGATYLSTVDSGIKIWNGTGFDTLQNRVNNNPLNPATNTLIGPEAEFTYRWRQANPTKTLYVVKYAVASTPLYDDGTLLNWSPGRSGGLFETMENAVTSAKAVLIAAGLHPVIRAELNMQGETDAGVNLYAGVYQTNKTAYIAAVRRRWGDANTKFVMGRVSASSVQTYTTTVYAAQNAVAAADSKVKLVNTDTYTLISGIHYDAASLIAMGDDMYTAYIS